MVFLLFTYGLFGQTDLFEWKLYPQSGRKSMLNKTEFDSSGTFDVLHYRFDLNFPLTSSYFSGSVTLFCRALEPLQGIDLQMNGLTIDKITLRGDSVSHLHRWEQLSLNFNETISMQDTFSLKIDYHGSPDEKGFYFYDRCAYTMAEPEEARYWFPCHDVPWDKATAELYITVPKGVEVASIGLLKNRHSSIDNRWETFHWSTDYPVATYLICITMSDEYALWSDWFVMENDTLEMPYYVFIEDSAKSRIDVKNMVEAMSFFTQAFGPYPFEKYGTATVTKAWFGGMEHQTMTTVVKAWFQGNGSVESGFVHELAHMWWGDAVTLSDWPAIWLNEGFATYSEEMFREYFYGRNASRSSLQYKKNVYVEQSAYLDFPVYDPPREHFFNWGITYIKGAWVLHMLRGVVGEEAFWQILPSYYNKYRYGNASISDFQFVCESVSGMSLDWFFQEWIYRKGYMRLAYDWKNYLNDQGSNRLRLMIEQQGPVFTMPLDIHMTGRDFKADTTLWISESRHQFSFLLPDSVTEIQLDPDEWILMTDTLMTSLIADTVFASPAFYAAPNPFQDRTSLCYILPENRAEWTVQIHIYNLRGRKVRTLVHRKTVLPDTYSIVWDGFDDRGRPMASGIYFAELRTDSCRKQCKLTIIR